MGFVVYKFIMLPLQIKLFFFGKNLLMGYNDNITCLLKGDYYAEIYFA